MHRTLVHPQGQLYSTLNFYNAFVILFFKIHWTTKTQSVIYAKPLTSDGASSIERYLKHQNRAARKYFCNIVEHQGRSLKHQNKTIETLKNIFLQHTKSIFATSKNMQSAGWKFPCNIGALFCATSVPFLQYWNKVTATCLGSQCWTNSSSWNQPREAHRCPKSRAAGSKSSASGPRRRHGWDHGSLPQGKEKPRSPASSSSAAAWPFPHGCHPGAPPVWEREKAGGRRITRGGDGEKKTKMTKWWAHKVDLWLRESDASAWNIGLPSASSIETQFIWTGPRVSPSLSLLFRVLDLVELILEN